MKFLKINKSQIKTYINVDNITRIEAIPLDKEGRIYIFTRDGRSYSIKVDKGKEDSVAEKLVSCFSEVIVVDKEGEEP